MKRTGTDRPYLSWCMVVRNAEATLEAALASARERTPGAEIVVVDTCSRDATPEIARRWADVFEVYRGPRGDWDTEMAAVDDMAAARQRSFDLASGRWRGWLDADDRLAGPEEAERLLRVNGRWKPAPRAGQKVMDATPVPVRDGGALPTLEDLLRFAETKPEITMLWAPYLYQWDRKTGAAHQWINRERIVRWDNPPRFWWQEAAHEVLVPRNPAHRPPYMELAHLLWVHEKVWDAAAYDYSLRRHSAIMLKQWEAGDRTHRRARYLAGFATAFWPDRELEFWQAALALGFTVLDRYRALIGLGGYHARRGLVWESQDAYAAARALRSDLPDAFYAAAEQAVARENWGEAVPLLRNGTRLDLNLAESEVNPRDHVIRWPSLLAFCLRRLATRANEAGLTANALEWLAEARLAAGQVRKRPEAGPDADEADSLWRYAENEHEATRVVLALKDVWDYLRRNDEPEKALALIEAFPWIAEHHPIRVTMEHEARALRAHRRGGRDYADFYNDQAATGWIPSGAPDVLVGVHPRVGWVSAQVAAFAPTEGRLLDVGCGDGLLGLPVLLANPSLRYTGWDVNREAIEHFQELLAEVNPVGWEGRVTLHEGLYPLPGSAHVEPYGAVLAGEIIEHVPDPVVWLDDLRHSLRPSGVLLLTTPWGAYDVGQPPAKNSAGRDRGDLGHLRAYTAWSLTRDLRDAGYHVEEAKRVGSAKPPAVLYGDALVARARAQHHPGRPGRPVAVAVAGSLWDWNGSTVERDGIGASEEMIIALGQKLAATWRQVDVFGPTPEEEVHAGVGYWPRAAIRHAGRDAVLLVSRAPGFLRQIREVTGDSQQPAVLWLQDTVYPDLTPEVAAQYRAIVAVSRWHADLTIRAHGLGVTGGHVRVIPNWLDREHFTGEAPRREPFHFIYASSPDRGLVKLLRLWPRVREMFPDATLAIFYGWKGAARLGGGSADAAWNQRYMKARRAYEELRHQRGIQEIGMVDHRRIAREFQRASAWLYPTDFTETFCTNAVKARAAGCVPVTTALAALNESAACPQAVLVDRIDADGAYLDGYDEAWLDGVRRAVATSGAERRAMSEDALERCSWEAVESLWREVLA